MNNRVKRISALVSFCLAPALYSFQASGQEAQFDMDILKSRGLDASLGDYFADSSKFMPGRQPVTLIINGNDKGTVTARFDKEGELCVDRSFLQSAGLQVPSALKGDKVGEAQCHDYKSDYPTTTVTALPGEEKLSLVVPQEALTNDIILPENVAHGGTAGLLNYSMMSSQSSYAGADSRYDQLALEDGVNIHDWLLRSRQMMTRIDGEMNSDVLYTYVQHTFEAIKTLMQAGQINIGSTLFSGASIDGIQFIPESGLVDNAGSGVSVSGIASSPQARVEVKQGGRLIYSTLVPAGPFTLENIPVTSLSMALDVTVIETNGAQSSYTIAADALRGSGLSGAQGLSVAMGRTQDKGDDGRQPWLLTFSDGWRVRPWLNMGAGAMAAQEYNALATQIDMLPLSNVTVSTALRASQDAHGDNTGHSSNLNMSYNATKTLAFSASATRYSQGYRELTDTLSDNFTQYSGQYSANVSWSNALLGSFSLGYSLNEGAGDSNDSRYLSASWGKSFRWASVSVNWQRLLNPSENDEHRNNANYGDMVYINVSVPVGTQRVSGYMHKRGDETRTGMSTSGSLSRNSYYTISTEHNNQDGDNSFNGTINSNLHYTQLGLSAGVEGTSRNSSMTLNGGIVAHGFGVTFSPYRVQDTYAIASIGDKVSGVEINTPDGPVWTDHWGQAVVPSLPAYKSARVEMNTETLPKNIDVNNGISVLAAGHGSVSDVNFSVLNVRRVMLNVTLSDGKPLPKNTGLVDGEGNYVTTAVDEGLVFLNDADQVKELLVVNDEGQRQCRITYQLAEKRNANELYEQTKGVCQ